MIRNRVRLRKSSYGKGAADNWFVCDFNRRKKKMLEINWVDVINVIHSITPHLIVIAVALVLRNIDKSCASPIPVVKLR